MAERTTLGELRLTLYDPLRDMGPSRRAMVEGLLDRAEREIERLRDALSHIKWIKDCGIDAPDPETGQWRNYADEERDHIYRIASEALAAIAGNPTDDAYRVDAERYRFLRAGARPEITTGDPPSGWWRFRVVMMSNPQAVTDEPSQIDAAIDAARAAAPEVSGEGGK